MARKSTPGLTERESEIMDAIWELGTASSEQIRKKLSGEPHDSSVRTILRILIDKGFVKANSQKRPTQYSSLVKKNKAQKSAARQLVKRLFGGSAETLVLRLLEDKQLTVEQLEEIKRIAAQPRKKGK